MELIQRVVNAADNRTVRRSLLTVLVRRRSFTFRAMFFSRLRVDENQPFFFFKMSTGMLEGRERGILFQKLRASRRCEG